MKTIFKILLILFILIIIGGIIFAVYIIMKQSKDNTIDIIYKKILIDSKDKNTNEVIVTDFTIYYNGSEVVNDITRSDSLVEVNIPVNYGILTIIPHNKDYYEDEYIIDGSKYTVYLNKIGNISIVQTGDLNSTYGSILLNISTTNINHKISICVRWSGNIIDVNSDIYSTVKKLETKLDCEFFNYLWVEQVVENHWIRKDKIISEAHCDVSFLNLLPPSRLEGFTDKCFYIDRDLNKEEDFLLTLNYKAYKVDENDFIKIFVIDSDLRSGKYVFEDDGKRDVGANDFLYIIKLISL